MSDRKAKSNRPKKPAFIKRNINFTGDITSIDVPPTAHLWLPGKFVPSPAAKTSTSTMDAMRRNMKSIEKTLINKNLGTVNKTDQLHPSQARSHTPIGSIL